MDRLDKLYGELIKQDYDAIFINNICNIRYLTGYKGDDAYLLVLASGEAFFITDSRYLEQAENDCRICPKLTIMQYSPARSPLENLISGLCHRFSLKSLAFEKDYLSYDYYEKLDQLTANTRLIAERGLVERFRKIKDDKELTFLKKATEIADLAYRRTLEYTVPGISEKELSAHLIYNLLDQGAESLSFPPIVASGHNGSLPHALPTEKKLEKGDFITFDFGAVYEGYHSDTTRTVIIGKPTEKQKEVYFLVKEAQASASALLKPGLKAKEAHYHAAQIIAKGGYGDYFTHGLGHGTGLNVHEAPTLNPASEDILARGNTVTCEPGIYIPGWGGVRIEDALIITAEGAEALGNISKELSIL